MSVLYGSSKNQYIVILKAGRISIAKPCMHPTTSALAENEHELALAVVFLLQLAATSALATALQLCASPSRANCWELSVYHV